MTDKELIALINKDTSCGMKCLIDTYASNVCAVVRSRLNGICSQDEIDECVNHVFADFYFNLKKFSSERCSIKTYLTVIARNRSIEIFRKHVRHISELHIEDEELIGISDSMNVESDNERLMLEQQLMNAVRQLGKPDAQIIIRKYFYSQTSKQIANDIGMTDANVRKHISRALEKLRIMLSLI